MSLQSFWIHGTSVQQEREGYFISKKREGNGAVFRTHGEEWFHFAIPTPVIVANKRSSLMKVAVFYRTTATATISQIEIYDTDRVVFSNDDLRGYNGDHSQQIDDKNSWQMPERIELKTSVGVSLKVNFGPSTKNEVPSVTFLAAGADFANEGI